MSPIEIGPRERGITLWSYRWQSGSKRPPLLFIGGILLFISSSFLGVLGNYVYRVHRLASEGKFAAGTVVKKVMHQASDSGNSNTSYEVDYNFTTVDGRKLEGHDTVDPDAWDQIKEGGSVQIEYAASRPRINQIGATTGGITIAYITLIVASIVWLFGATFAVKGLRSQSSAPISGGAPETTAASVVKSGNIEVEVPSFLKDVSPWTIFGSILLVCGAIFLLIGVVNLRLERAFRAEGKTATAIVLTKSSHEEYEHQNDTRQTHYDVSYRFVTADGQSIESSEEVNWRTWRSIHERDPIQIIYLPQRPSRNRLAADHPGFLLWFLAMLGAVLTGGGAILLVYGPFATARKRRKS